MHKSRQNPSSRRKALTAALSVLAFAVVPAQFAKADEAANWPERPVTLIVPFAAGGPTDITGRVLGDGLSRIWGQSVVIENRAGAGGTIGAAATAKAANNGYTLILGVTGSHSIAGSLYQNLPYDPSNDFEAVAKAVIYPNTIFANPSLPADNLQDLLKLAKENQNYRVYGTDGNGTASHLTMELLGERAGVDFEAVQYKGSSPLINDVIGGFTPYGITGLPSVEPHLQSGKLKMIAITTDQDYGKRGYPTIAEQGFPGFAAAPWSGIFAPKGTPRAIVEKIAADIKTVLSSPEAVERLEAVGMTPMPVTLDEFEADLEKERANWAAAVKAAGIQPQ